MIEAITSLLPGLRRGGSDSTYDWLVCLWYHAEQIINNRLPFLIDTWRTICRSGLKMDQKDLQSSPDRPSKPGNLVIWVDCRKQDVPASRPPPLLIMVNFAGAQRPLFYHYTTLLEKKQQRNRGCSSVIEFLPPGSLKHCMCLFISKPKKRFVGPPMSA